VSAILVTNRRLGVYGVFLLGCDEAAGFRLSVEHHK